MLRVGYLRGESKRHKCRSYLEAQFTVPILTPPSSQKRTRDSIPPRRRCDLAVSQIAFLHNLELVGITPVPPARNIPGC